MAQPQQIISDIYPYLPIRVEVRGQHDEGLALVDTGYSGTVVIPSRWLARGIGLPDGLGSVEVADGRIIDAPVYLGNLIAVGFASFPDVRITVMGDEYILGRGVLDHYRVIFDHGARVILEI